jgi:hypothetical protein
MTVEEAQRIAERADRGELDLQDPDIRRAVNEARRRLVRASVWGRTDEERRRTRATVLVMSGAVLLFVLGLGLAIALPRP